MSLKSSLLNIAERHCLATGMSKARLATLIANDGKFFDRIEAGGGFTARTYERALQWFSTNWPDNAEWPAGVERPAPAERAA
jgi:hypothetical protein